MNAHARVDVRRYDDSLSREHSWAPLEVEGTLPPDLQGTLYRNGPLSRESQGSPVSHMFEADGGLAAVRFSDGAMHGAARILRTRAYVEEEQAGRPLYGYAAPWLTRVRMALSGKAKNAANTNVIPWNGELWALYEGSLPTRVDPETLEFLGETTHGGIIPATFSAHPHTVAGRHALYNFGLVYGRQTRLDLFELPLDGRPSRRLSSVALPAATMLHDFAATERHLVFLVSPVRVNVMRAIAGLGPADKLLRWEPDLGTEVIVVPIDDPERVTRFTVPAFYQWHFANAFERGDSIVIDYCHYEAFTMELGDDNESAVLYRAVVDPKRQTLRQEALNHHSTEFPQVHPSVSGAEHQVVYTVGVSDTQRYRLCRFDLDGGERFAELDDGQLASEPVVVPRSQEEHDAWLLSLVYDGRSHTSFLWVVDAATMEEQARGWFAHHIPRTFHGTWVPASK